MTPARPGVLVAVVGTATEVGKTWITAKLVTELRGRGLAAVARKPVQSFAIADLGHTDADILANASGETANDVCPPHRWLARPMAPPMAAAALGEAPPLLADLVAELLWPTPLPDVGFVETIGGLRSPIADDADSRSLAHGIDPDLVVVVAEAGLGVIDAVRMATDALAARAWRAPDPLVFLNHFDPDNDLHCRNVEWLRSRDGFDVTTRIAELVERFIAATNAADGHGAN